MNRSLAPAITLAAAIALWLASGVEPDEVARYLGYELVYVIGPGVLLLGAISPGTRGPLARLALGWPLGLVCEIAVFSATAALDARDLFYACPAIVGIPAALVWWLRSRDRGDGAAGALEAARGRAALAFSPAQIWTIAALCLMGFGYLGLTLIAKSPIPGSASNVFYDPDSIFHLSLIAEAKHHWPLTTPQVSGVELRYHYFAHLHAAAISQVTGIEAPIVFFRLFMLPLIALIALQAALAGRAISGIAWVGPLAAALVLLVRAFDLIVPDTAPFLDGNTVWLWNSPSYTFGLVFFIPLTLLLAALLDDRVRERIPAAGRGPVWALFALLLLGGAGSKFVTLPLLLGGLGLFVIWAWARERRLDRRALAALGLTLGVAIPFLLLYYGTNRGLLAPGAAQIYGLMNALIETDGVLGNSAAAELAHWGIGSLLGSLILFGPPLLGLIWVLGPGRDTLRPGQRLLLCVLATGFLGFLFVHDETGPENYFVGYGLIAAFPVVAEGLYRSLASGLSERADRSRIALAVAAWLALCLALAFAGWQLRIDGHLARSYLVIYPLLAACVLAMVVWARRAPPAKRPARVALVTLAVLIPAGLDIVLDTVPETVRNVRDGVPLYDSVRWGMNPGEYEAAAWIRENTPEEAVIAVSNQHSPRARDSASLHQEIPVFAERRAFDEGWVYAFRSVKINRNAVLYGRRHPYPYRAELEERAYERDDPRAVRTMIDKYGVTYLVLDVDDGKLGRRVRSMGRLVFDNDAVEVIELEPR